MLVAYHLLMTVRLAMIVFVGKWLDLSEESHVGLRILDLCMNALRLIISFAWCTHALYAHFFLLVFPFSPFSEALYFPSSPLVFLAFVLPLFCSR